MNGKANYLPLYVRANEIDDIDKLAERAEQVLEQANGFYITANDFRDSAVIDAVRLDLLVKISNRIQERKAKRDRKAPDGSVYRSE